MKLIDAHIDGFGVWSDLSLADLSPQCTVFYGPNEAGKTTLLEFLRRAVRIFARPYGPLFATGPRHSRRRIVNSRHARRGPLAHLPSRTRSASAGQCHRRSCRRHGARRCAVKSPAARRRRGDVSKRLCRRSAGSAGIGYAFQFRCRPLAVWYHSRYGPCFVVRCTDRTYEFASSALVRPALLANWPTPLRAIIYKAKSPI